MEIPGTFRERYTDIVDDPDEFFHALERQLPKSFRVNSLKSSAGEIKGRFEDYGIAIRQMGWYPDAFVSEDPKIGGTLEHFLGSIYLQEIVSMLPPLVMEPSDLVLDACAAPGSKTTQLAALMGNRGTIIANDKDYGRIRALRFNLEKTGTLNTVITNYDLRSFPKLQFPSILLDAPCSAEGTARKSESYFRCWSIKTIKGQAKQQKQLIMKAFELLAPGGTLVYSTCTLAPEENEEVLSHLLQNTDASLESISLPGFTLSPPVMEWDGKGMEDGVRKAVRVWPHHNDTGGFFMAKVRK